MTMESEVLMKDKRGGDVYIGVVGPVRSGKSTLIQRFAEEILLAGLSVEEQKRLKDELPQSAQGKTIMTTEPKFLPEKAAEVSFCGGKGKARVRFVDCVGYPIAGAFGFEEDGNPRMVLSSWSEEPISLEKAAEIGTQKVVKEHSSVALVVTSDGSFTEIPRESYAAGEERAIQELTEQNKPFLLLINTKNPKSKEVISLTETLKEKYSCPVQAENFLSLNKEELSSILEEALLEFPVLQVDVSLPDWIQVLPAEGEIVKNVLSTLRTSSLSVRKLKDCSLLQNAFDSDETLCSSTEIGYMLPEGRVTLSFPAREGVFYRVLSKECGEDVSSAAKLMEYVRLSAEERRELAPIREAYRAAKEGGYGVAAPTEGETELLKPECFKEGSSYGVRFLTRASGYHIVRVDVDGEISPVIGEKDRTDEFYKDVLSRYEENPSSLWQTEFFGKSVKTLVGEELKNKTSSMPVALQKKMRKGITKIVNEGKGNLILFVF